MINLIKISCQKNGDFFFIKFAKTQGEISDLKRKNFKAQGKNSPENRSKKIGLNYVIVSNQARDTW